MSFFKNKRVLVTGGSGFIGRHLVRKLEGLGAVVRGADINVLTPTKDSRDLDLMVLDDCIKACEGQEIVFNLAAKVGGISHNGKNQGSMMRENSVMNLNMLEAARLMGVKRFVLTSSACIYPRTVTIPTPESEGFLGHPDPSNYGYGWAKRLAEVQAACYIDQYGMDIKIVRPYNAYGPGDRFDETGHVIACLIKRTLEEPLPLTVWGSGEPTRSFLYVDDFVDGLLLAAEKFPQGIPINLCDGREVRISYIAEIICEAIHDRVDIKFDRSKPDGQPRRLGDITLAKSFGFSPKVDIETGIKKTIEWYIKTHGR